MTHTKFDPALIGIWLLPGHPETYEISAGGGYFIAEPHETVIIKEGGAVMTWGGRRYIRVLGEGSTPVGTWQEEATGDAWDFTDDQGYSVLTAAAQTFTGIWALRNHGTSLWTCEKQADLETDGAHLIFNTPAGEQLKYGYAVEDGILSILDPATWLEVSRYISAERMVRNAHG